MPTFQNRENASILGASFPSVTTIESSGGELIARQGDNALPVAKVGQLTTRTDADTGELTMSSGHGITTGDRLDVYWTGGSRRGMTAGTVATNAVPIDGGSGDDLPTNLTAVTASVPVEEEMLLTGDDATCIAMFSSRRGSIVLAESDDSEALGREVGAESGGEQSWFWHESRNETNPLASADVAKVFFSNGDSSNTAVMRVAVLH